MDHDDGAAHKIVRFGVYECDLASGQLCKSGRKVKLSDQPFRLLAMLVEQPGTLVTREELQQRLWPDQPYGEFSDGLNTAVNRLRAALDDNAETPRFVETVPKRGYRFIAEAWTEDVKPRGEPAKRASRARLWRWTVLTGGTAVVILAAAIVATHLSSRKAVANTPRVALAVMSFENLTGNAANDYLAEGLTQEVTTRFARDYGGGLKVVMGGPLNTAGSGRRNIPQLARYLGVQYFIEGSVQGGGRHVRVAAQLIRARDQSSLWADSYDGDASQLLQFESSVAGSVGEELALKLLPGQARPRIPVTFAAHDDYLRGLYDLSKRSRDGFNHAAVRFADATASDPHYANAYAELAVTYDLMGQYSWIDPDYARSLGQAAAEQAMALDPSLPEAHAALGFSDWFYRWDAAEGERELRRAIQLSPNNVDAHHWYSQILMTAGRFKEAEDQMKAALALDPQSLILQTNLGWLYFYEQKYPQAIAQFERVARENPDFISAHFKALQAYALAGDKADSWKETQKEIRLALSAQNQRRILREYRTGGYSAALHEIAELSDALSYGSDVDSARFLMLAGDKTKALAYLKLAFEAKEGWIMYVPFDPVFAPLHSNPQYIQLVKSIKPLPNHSV